MRERRRFPISPVGWIGIAAAMLGLAYFLLPAETAEQRAERRPADTREAGAAPAMRNEVAAPAAREPTTRQPGTTAKNEQAAAVDTPDERSK